MSIPNIPNAYENISNACEKRLTELYPAGVPVEIRERYNQELAMLKNSDVLDDFEIFRCLSEESKKCTAILYARSTVPGSILYYLLSNSSFDPLPVYYYCPKCGHYEEVHTHLFGIDLPAKKCPTCGSTLTASGFGLPIESVWGTDGSKDVIFECNASSDFYPFAKRVLMRLYPENEIVPWCMFTLPSNGIETFPDANPVGISQHGFAVIPTGFTINDYPDLLTYQENGDPCLAGSGRELRNNRLKPIYLMTSESTDNLLDLQKTTGIYVNEISPNHLKGTTWGAMSQNGRIGTDTSVLFQEFQPQTFTQMVSLTAACHNSYLWDDGTIYWNSENFKKMVSTPEFKKYPCYYREDFFDYLCEAGMERSKAFEISEFIRCGRATMPKKKEIWDSFQMPAELRTIAEHYRYLFPRAHCVEFALQNARLAYYARIDSRAYSKIIYNK